MVPAGERFPGGSTEVVQKVMAACYSEPAEAAFLTPLAVSGDCFTSAQRVLFFCDTAFVRNDMGLLLFEKYRHKCRGTLMTCYHFLLDNLDQHDLSVAGAVSCRSISSNLVNPRSLLLL
jgi:hypothetical protein